MPVSVVTSTRAGVVEQTGRYRIDEDGIGAILLLAHTPQVCRWWATKQAAS